MITGKILREAVKLLLVNPLECNGTYNATSSNMKLVHWLSVGGLLYLVQGGGTGRGRSPPGPPRCTKCNSPPVNGQYTSNRIAV